MIYINSSKITVYFIRNTQLLSNYIGVTDSLPHGRLALFAIFPLFLVRFGRSHLEFDKEAISDGFMAHFRVFRGKVGLIVSDFEELIFCGPYVPYFLLLNKKKSKLSWKSSFYLLCCSEI